MFPLIRADHVLAGLPLAVVVYGRIWRKQRAQRTRLWNSLELGFARSVLSASDHLGELSSSS